MATIEEKAKEFAGLNSDSKDILACLLRSLTYKGYMAGAEWMLEKAVERYSSELDDFINLLGFLKKKTAGLIDKEKSIEKFRKAMEE